MRVFPLKKLVCALMVSKDNFFTKLIKEDNNISTLNFFVVVTIIIGVVLLIIPSIGMCVDIWYNHTITINMSDFALYIGAIASMFGAVGLTNAWTEQSYSKYHIHQQQDLNGNGIPDDEEECLDDDPNQPL